MGLRLIFPPLVIISCELNKFQIVRNHKYRYAYGSILGYSSRDNLFFKGKDGLMRISFPHQQPLLVAFFFSAFKVEGLGDIIFSECLFVEYGKDFSCIEKNI